MQVIAVIRLSVWKQTTSKCFVYLLKLYSTSIILLLKNNLTNICSKTSKIEMNLLLNGLYLQYEKLWKVRKMGRRSMYFASLTKIMGDL